MIEYREYKESDLYAYKKFCLKNFGSKKHQIKSSYLAWLYDGKPKTFTVAISGKDIVGIIHNFKAPIIINGGIKSATVLHDLMVDKNFRGNVGFQLINSAINSDDYTVLPGSVGRLARAYGRLGSKRFDSYWHKKYLIPKNLFYRKKLKDISKYQVRANETGLQFGCNKGMKKHVFLESSLTNFIRSPEYSEYFKWRFLAYDSPLTFYVSDTAGKNAILFVVGKKGMIPYLRIFYTNSESETVLTRLVHFIEKYASDIGIPIVLFTCFECPPPQGSNYIPYNPMPLSFVFSKKKDFYFVPNVPSFCSDLSFEGLNPYE